MTSDDSEARAQAISPETSDPSEAPSARAKPLPRRLPVAPPPAALEPAPPVLAPARMINEVLYCERLMYLEYVQGEWADNAFTADGHAVHRRVNEEGKPLRAAPDGESEAEEARPYVARSVSLYSERLGIAAKLDLVEVEGGHVVPVEYKRSARPDVPGGAYLPELAQVCAQVLLLREHGYACEYGEIYYAKDRQRVVIEIPEWLIARTLAAADRIRELALAGVLPPPLEDSPKCHGCSLVGICLPDETRALSTEPELEDDPSMDVGDDPWGLAVGVERSAGAITFSFRCFNVSSIIVSWLNSELLSTDSFNIVKTRFCLWTSASRRAARLMQSTHSGDRTSILSASRWSYEPGNADCPVPRWRRGVR